MNEQTLEAITTPHPNLRQCYARLLAATCMTNYPHLRRASITYVWAEVTLYTAHNKEFSKMVLKARIGGVRRFVALTFDIWAYWLERKA
jgi:hypothetical protein